MPLNRWRRLRARTALKDLQNPDLREAVFDLFDEAQRRVDEEDVDLIVLCARRLACVYQLLLRHGYPPLKGAMVVSDRFLDLSCDWHWKNVLVLDDSVVLGTTLSGVFDDVAGRVGEDGQVHTAAICVDTDKRATYLLDRIHFQSMREVPSTEVQRFSTNIVQALFRSGVPFFSDFPVTRTVRLRTEQFLDYLRTDGWHVADVTAPVISTERETAWVQIPTAEMHATNLSRVPVELSTLVEAFKLRCYTQRRRDSASNVYVSLVPIALLRACREHELDDALDALSRLVGNPDLERVDWPTMHATAKHRIVQIYASAALFAAALDNESLIAALDHQTDDAVWLDTDALRLYFGSTQDWALDTWQTLRKTVRANQPGTHSDNVSSTPEQPPTSGLLDDDDLRSLIWEQRELFNQVAITAPDPGQMTKVGLVAAHAINSIFGYISRHFEEPQQAAIRALPNYDTYRTEYLEHPEQRVLNRVLTMRELAGAVSSDSWTSDAWERALISLGVDIGNDLGIVVPATTYDSARDLVYRGYRLGETAQLASTPLSRWQPSNDPATLDAFLKAAANGFPLNSENSAIAFHWRRIAKGSKMHEADELAAQELQAMRERVIPGTIVGLYDGVVTDVNPEEDFFSADLTNVTDFGIGQAMLSIRQVSAHERVLVRPGITFHWTIFERELPTGLDRTSRLRFVSPRRLDREAMAAAAARELSFLDDTE